MKICLLASYRHGGKSTRRDQVLLDNIVILDREYGAHLPGMEWRKLDLVAGGRAFADITGLRGLHLRQHLWNRYVLDVWGGCRGQVFQHGRGYPEWVWQSVYTFIRVSAEGGRTWRLLVE